MRRSRPQRVSGLVVGLVLLVLGVAGLGGHSPISISGYASTLTNSANTAASAARACRNAASPAYLVYPLDEQSGATTATDVSGNSRDGRYSAGGVTFGVPGPCTLDGGRAVRLDGAAGSVASPAVLLTLLSFSEAVWFRTTSTSGGLLVGVGNAASGLSSSHDRALYVTNSGAVAFEVQPLTGPTVITSPRTYNDGTWHLAVATFSASGGMTLYVDGAAVASNPGVTTALGLSVLSYWRIGYDSLSGVGTTAPSSPFFTGSLAYVSTYTTAISATQVSAMWNARS